MSSGVNVGVAIRVASASGHLDCRGEDIAAAAHGFDHRRPLRIVLELPAKPPDLDIDCSVEWPCFSIAGEIEQSIAGQHLIGVAYKSGEQIEFAGGQPDLLARGREQFPAGEIEVPAGEPGPRAGRGLPVGVAARCPAQHALDPRQQLPQVKRLGQVVVRSHFEANDAVDDLAPTGQDDDPDARLLAQRTSECQPILAGQHQI